MGVFGKNQMMHKKTQWQLVLIVISRLSFCCWFRCCWFNRIGCFWFNRIGCFWFNRIDRVLLVQQDRVLLVQQDRVLLLLVPLMFAVVVVVLEMVVVVVLLVELLVVMVVVALVVELVAVVVVVVVVVEVVVVLVVVVEVVVVMLVVVLVVELVAVMVVVLVVEVVEVVLVMLVVVEVMVVDLHVPLVPVPLSWHKKNEIDPSRSKRMRLPRSKRMTLPSFVEAKTQFRWVAAGTPGRRGLTMPTSGKFSHSHTNMRWDRPNSRMQLNSAELQEVGQQPLKMPMKRSDEGQQPLKMQMKMSDEPQAIFHIQIQFKLQTCFEMRYDRSKTDSAELRSPGQLAETPQQIPPSPVVPQASLEIQTNRLIARKSAISVKQGQTRISAAKLHHHSGQYVRTHDGAVCS